MVELAKPAFNFITDYGDVSRPETDKARMVLRSVDLLTELGVNGQLVADLQRATTQLTPLLYLTYSESPLVQKLLDEGDLKVEGRGTYHTGFVNGKQVDVYLKGSGNTGLLDEMHNPTDHVQLPPNSDGVYPGYPRGSTHEVLFFDNLKNYPPHPRITGTETGTWGTMEMINSSIVLAALAEHYGWTIAEDVMKAGLPIPIGMLELSDLSQVQLKLLNTLRQSETNPDIQKSLAWSGNRKGLALVGCISPSDKRYTIFDHVAFSKTAEEAEPALEALKNKARWEQSGSTLRQLLEIGIVYSFSSSHGQNLYQVKQDGSQTPLCSPADASDYVFLGHYQPNKHPFLLYQMLSRWAGLTPNNGHFELVLSKEENGYPIISLDYAAARNNYQAFLKNFTAGVVNNDDVIKTTADIMPFLRTDINLALSQLMTNRVRNAVWKTNATRQKMLLEKYNQYGSLTELRRKLKLNLEGGIENYPSLLRENQKDVQGLIAFLSTGNRADLSPHVKQVADLAHELDQIQDLKKQDHFSTRILRVMSNKIDLFEMHDNESFFRENGKKLLPYLLQLVKSNDWDNLDLFLDIIEVMEDFEIQSDPFPAKKAKNITQYFLLSLEKGVDIPELHTRAQLMRSIMYTNTTLAEQNSLLTWTKKEIRMPHPEHVYNQSMLHFLEQTRTDRERMLKMLDQFFKKEKEYRKCKDTHKKEGLYQSIMQILSEYNMFDPILLLSQVLSEKHATQNGNIQKGHEWFLQSRETYLRLLMNYEVE